MLVTPAKESISSVGLCFLPRGPAGADRLLFGPSTTAGTYPHNPHLTRKIGQDASPGGGTIPVSSAAASARGPSRLAVLGHGAPERNGGRGEDPAGLV